VALAATGFFIIWSSTMALVIADRVKETSATTGTGTLDLDGAATGFQTFVAGVGTTNITYYAITNGTDWEVGLGTVTDATPDTLSRTTVLQSSNADALVSFTGSLTVFSTGPADKLCVLSSEGSLGLGGTDPQNLASWASGSNRTWVNINNASYECGFVAEGDIASLNLIDNGGASDDKWYRVYVDGGLIRHGSTLDSGSARNTNIFTMDMGNENIGFGSVPDASDRFYIYSGDEDCVWTADSNRASADDILYQISAEWNATEVARIKFAAGFDNTNKDDGYLSFHTGEGGTLAEAFRIEQNGESLFYKSASFDYFDNGNSGTSDTIDWGLSNYQLSTLTGNVTYTFTDPTYAEVGSFTLILTQDMTGSRTASWPMGVDWGTAGAPTLSTSGTDIVCFIFDGTTYRGTYSLGYM